jgi:hypothetical protein
LPLAESGREGQQRQDRSDNQTAHTWGG